jgi:heme exporter protein D
MTWNSASEFFSMGGYGLYVWGSYAMAAALLIGEPIAVWRRSRQALRNIETDTE